MLTASHCGRHEYVIVGEHDKTVADGEKKYMVEKRIDHPAWNLNHGMESSFQL